MKTNVLLKTLLLSIPFMFNLNTVNAQGWEKTYGGVDYETAWSSVQQTIDGGYITAGFTNSFGAGGYDVYLVKTNANGDTLWTKTYGGTDNDYGYSVQQTSDGGYIIAGRSESFGAGDYDVYLIKTDANGDTVWTKTYGGTDNDYGFSVQQTTDGGYIISGSDSSLFNGKWDIILIKTNANGDTLWTKTFGGTDDDAGYSVLQTNDGGYIIAGYTKSFGAGMWDVYLIKTNANGNTLWTKTYGGIKQDLAKTIKQTNDNGYIIVGWTNSNDAGYIYDVYLIKTDENGDTLWTKTYGGINYDEGRSVQQTVDGGYIVSGWTNSFGAGLYDVYLIKTHANGDTIWTKTYGGINDDQGFSVQQTDDGGYIIGGRTSSFGAGNFDMYLIKTDMQGNSITNIISGNIFHDINTDCIIDTGESMLPNWLIKVEPGPKYATTNSNGYYSVLVDTGTYTVKEFPPNNLWAQTCPVLPYYTVNFTTFYDTSYNNNFANEIAIYCPLLEVDISTWAIRPCFQSTYSVIYCNNGTAPADNATIEVELDDNMTYAGGTGNLTSQIGNILTFDIGTVIPGQCETFYFYVDVTCDMSLLGQTMCVEAHIYPDSLCFPPDITWDHSSVAVEGECIGDSSACFTIYNTGDPGTGDMAGTSEYRIYENNILVDTGTFQIAGGDSHVICWPANGNTIRLEADQRPGHPGNSHPQDNVEMCGDSTGTFVTGQITVIPEDDIDANVEIDCRVVTGSYDPNEKLVKPIGLTANHYIDSTDVLEYQINFQNVGTDTAFNIVISDTLSAYLNVTTVETGTSSHPYTFKIYGNGILEWKFNNIFLPDSNVNESASHGFVKYKVSQIPNNPKGTLIENRAGIIFDYNAPVITDVIWNIVFDTILTSISMPVVYNNSIEVKVFPNPFNTITTFVISGLREKEQYNFILYDLIGKEVKEIKNISNNIFQLRKGNLPAGMYFYRLLTEKETIATGKIIIN